MNWENDLENACRKTLQKVSVIDKKWIKCWDGELNKLIDWEVETKEKAKTDLSAELLKMSLKIVKKIRIKENIVGVQDKKWERN